MSIEPGVEVSLRYFRLEVRSHPNLTPCCRLRLPSLLKFSSLVCFGCAALSSQPKRKNMQCYLYTLHALKLDLIVFLLSRLERLEWRTT